MAARFPGYGAPLDVRCHRCGAVLVVERGRPPRSQRELARSSCPRCAWIAITIMLAVAAAAGWWAW